MKKVLSVLLMVVFVFGLSSNIFSQNNKVAKKDVIKLTQYSQHELHNRSFVFFNTFIEEEQNTFIKKDVDEDWIVGFFTTKLDNVAEEIKYKVTVNVREGEYDYNFTEVIMPEGAKNEVDKFFKRVGEVLEKTMITKEPQKL
ncbi:MAG: hypothetical protein HN704_09000 [Bacteroidetes bacterium]|jgi:hypothetical protein|nr:hypothetical protein [Bacteroidota bacterium]MBT7142978.1 hypothetical protein [Bacteroidota bacterium]MBT7491729.1 hypothetical protein [Bacteroidota bacterium]